MSEIKISQLSKEAKKAIVKEMRDNHIKFHILRNDETSQLGGAMVVATRNVHKNSKMMDIAVSYCNEQDQFKKLDGCILAGTRIESGACITIPVKGLFPKFDFGDFICQLGVK